VQAIAVWQLAPVYPGLQVQPPVEPQTPFPLQVVDAWQKVQKG
jgi:hypothetical protein